MTKSIRVPRELAQMIRHLATDAEKDVSDYFAEKFGAAVANEYDKMRDRHDKQRQNKK